MNRLQGTITALITPFNETGTTVAFDALTTLVETQIAAGVSGLLPLGTTGETPTLTAAEKDAVLQHVVTVTNGRVPVMAGTGTNATATTIEATKKAVDLGADSVLVVTPYYNKPSQDGLYSHFEAVCESVSTPLVVYNIAGRTGVNIETKTLQRIAALDNVIGVKEASGDIGQIGSVIQTIQNQSATFAVMSGDDALTLPVMALGGTGVISVTSNLVPEQVVALVNSALSGDFERARKQHFALTNLFSALFIESNPVPLKRALELSGFPAGPVRAPLAPLTPVSEAALLNVLAEYKEILPQTQKKSPCKPNLAIVRSD